METCCFCLADIVAGQSTITLKCDHIFHVICLNQYQNDSCPLCRGDKIIKQKNFSHTDINHYNDNEYVWIFGSFFPMSHAQRKNYLVFKQGHKKFITGYFWRLFDSSVSDALEKQYKDYVADSTKNNVQIEIGSSTYNINYNNIEFEKYFSNPNIEIVSCIQQSQSNRSRPILRMVWGDVVKNLLVVGIHDNTFFDKIYMFSDSSGDYLFDMINQQKINQGYADKKNMQKIFVNNSKYLVNINDNTIVDTNNKIVYKIDVYNKHTVENY